MKEKGFTLVELLAVIVVIGLLATIVLPQVLNQFSNQTSELTEDEIKLIEQGASTYAMENGKKYKGKLSFVSIEELLEEEAIDENLAKEAGAIAENNNVTPGVTINYLGSTPITTYEDMEEMFLAKEAAYNRVSDNISKYEGSKTGTTLAGLVFYNFLDGNAAAKINPDYDSGLGAILINYCGEYPQFEYIEVLDLKMDSSCN